jgi:hypothetical protein
MGRHHVYETAGNEEYEKAVAGSYTIRDGPPAWTSVQVQAKQPLSYKMLHSVSDFGGSCENGIELSGSTKGGKFLDQLSDF